MSNHTFSEPGVDLDKREVGPFENTPEPTTPTRSGLASVYDSLRKELTKPADIEEFVTLRVPNRDKLSVKFSTDLPLQKLNRWRTSSVDKKTKEPDLLRFNTFIIAGQGECLVFNGEDAFDDNGDKMNFHHKEVQESLNSLDYAGAVKTLYSRDADILKVGAEVLAACGYDQDDDDELSDNTDPLD